MDTKTMTPEEIKKFNTKVEYNESIFSWIVDVVSIIIAWPMLFMAIYRRSKYNKRIPE